MAFFRKAVELNWQDSQAKYKETLVETPGQGERMHWHQKTAEQTFKEQQTLPQGLSKKEAEERYQEFGPNELEERKRKTPAGMLLDQFKDFMILVLIAAAVISGAIGELKDSIVIVIIVILNAVIGFVQEYRAEKAMEALKKIASLEANVWREGTVMTVPATQVVPGDIVLLEAGRIVPADMRLFEAARLTIDESPLTGESVPVDKKVEPISEEDIPLGDRRNMAYSGTFVTYGRGTGIVVSTGMRTELGRIASLLQEEEELKTPLQRRLARFGQKLALSIMAICAIVFIVGLIRGEQVLLMFLTAVSLAVAAIPEALPAVITISLALGAKRMVERRALIRKLPAVETLGSVTYICSDKTGTLTENKMKVEELYVDGETWTVTGVGYEPVGNFLSQGKALRREDGLNVRDTFFKGLALCNDAHLLTQSSKPGGNQIVGDPTEAALVVVAAKRGYHKEALKEAFPRVAEIPFDSERKRMTTIHEKPDGGYVSFTKGALDVLLELTVAETTSSGVRTLSTERKRQITKVAEKMAAHGLRVLGLTCKFYDSLPQEVLPVSIEDELVFLGIVGILDPPRPEAKEAVSLCKKAGMRPVMVTGDHPLTAKNIARRLGILNRDGVVMTGEELARLPLEQLEQRAQKVSVYARISPEQKLKIVRALQEKGEMVAMTGDGVNDAPALKRADIGIAMGITGTDVSKEASDMILLDDNFATIVGAVREGRRIYDNIRKFIRYTMTSNSGEIWTIFLAPFLGLPIPLLPIHILWINLVTDGLPGLALAAEPEEKAIMERPPRSPKESVFAHGMAWYIIVIGLLMGGVSLVAMAWAFETGHAHWQTIVFTVLCLSQMGNVLAIRSERTSLFTQGLFSNLPLVGAVVLTFVLQMMIIYVPALQDIFKTQPLSASELILSLVASSVVFLAVEAEKAWRRRKESEVTAL